MLNFQRTTAALFLAPATKAASANIALASLYTAATLLVPGSAFGSEPDVEVSKGAQLEEVIVTAEKRATNLQDTPIAVTAFSADFVEQSRLQTIQDLNAKVPGFSFASFSKSRTVIALRGGSSALQAPGSDNAVATFIDEVYFGGAGELEFDLVDVERIEVLRGPQGTLNGRNTTGGSVNIITKKPTENFEAMVEGGLGNFDLRQVRGYVSGPLFGSDAVFGSLSLASIDRGGTSRNRADAGELDTTDRTTVRAKLLWKISDSMELTIAADAGRMDETNSARDFIGPPPTADMLEAVGFQPDNQPFVVDQFDNGRYRMDSRGALVKLDVDAWDGTVTSVSSYRYLDTWQTPEDIIGVPLPFAAVADARRKDQISQELRWVSNDAARLRWVVGLYFLYQDDQQTSNWVTTYDPSTFAGALQAATYCPLQGDELNFAMPACVAAYPELFDINSVEFHQRSEVYSYAAYFQGTYDITDALRLTAGGRVTRDRKNARGYNIGDADFIFNPDGDWRIDRPISKTWDEFTPRVVLEWEPSEELLIYGSVTEGFRSGAFFLQGSYAESLVPVEPETVRSYEVGFKSRFWDNRAQLNLAAFRAEYEGFQLNRVTSEGDVVADNAGGALVQGVELEVGVVPVENLTLSISYSFQDGETTNLPPEFGVPDGTPPAQTPEHTVNASVSYTMTFGNGVQVTPYADAQYKSDYQLELSEDRAFQSGVDHLVNAGIKIMAPNERLSMTLWGKNLTNEAIVTYGQDLRILTYTFDEAFNPGSSSFNPAAAAANMPRYAPPRTYGVSFRYDF